MIALNSLKEKSKENTQDLLVDIARRVLALENTMDVVVADVAFLLKDRVIAAAAEVLNLALHKQPRKSEQCVAFTSKKGRGQLITATVGTSITNFGKRANEILNQRNQRAVHYKDAITLENDVNELIEKSCNYRELENDSNEIFTSSVLVLCNFSKFKPFFK